jgi:SAM-dependent methyltransferase
MPKSVSAGMGVIEKNAVQPEVRLWEEEYGTLKVIPSSSRKLPSKALLLFSELLDFPRFKKVLDAGCGIGRNSIYLAQKGCEVHAVDISQTALATLQDAALKARVQHRISVHNIPLRDNFPFEENAFDLVLDSYVFCHFVDESFRRNYRQELHRVTRPGGFVFSSLFSVEDEYYKSMIKNEHGANYIVTDPNNGITKRLYTEAEIKNFYALSFEVFYFVKFEFVDVVLGNPYRRSILALALRKPT